MHAGRESSTMYVPCAQCQLETPDTVTQATNEKVYRQTDTSNLNQLSENTVPFSQFVPSTPSTPCSGSCHSRQYMYQNSHTANCCIHPRYLYIYDMKYILLNNNKGQYFTLCFIQKGYTKYPQIMCIVDHTIFTM